MTIVEMWKAGIISVGDQVRSAIHNEKDYPGKGYLEYGIKNASKQIEFLWIYEVCELEDMQHFRKIFSKYAMKRFRIFC